jgi:hypothetical protein
MPHGIQVVHSNSPEVIHGKELKNLTGAINLENVNIAILVGIEDDLVMITGLE